VNAKSQIYKVKGLGTSFYELVELAKSFGFESLIYKTTDIKSLSYPSIVSIRFFGFRHYRLVYESRDTYLMVMDPAMGKLVRVRKKTFAALWTGVFMCIRPQGLTIAGLDDWTTVG